MPLPENKAPFKTMNIKSALLAAANRKRKATSPSLPVKHIKNIDDIKHIKDTSDDEIEVITVDSDTAAIGDCKENTDLNVVKGELNTPVVEKTTPPSLNNVQKDGVKSDTVQNSDLSACDRSMLESSDELNSSNLNNSLNALHSNELSETGDTQSKSEKEVSPVSKKRTKSDSTLKTPSEANQNDLNTKKKRKMTSEEAKKKSEAREQKRKELLDKKKALDAQKLKRKLEKEQMKIQKEMERQEKENERKAKEKLKQEKKEQEEKERQQKLKEKEDQKKIRQMQLEMKLEEKKKKEELKSKREEEMKKAEEEKQKAKLEKEQKEKEKLERNKAAFMKFFVPSNKIPTTPVAPEVVEKEGAFKPFQVSDDMTLAPVVPPVAQERFNKDKLDRALELQGIQELYLQILKSGKYKDVRLRKRLRKPRACDEVIIIDNIEPSELFLKAKLLQFSENVRPPYWGTWRKKSTKIGPRNPFGQEDIFDYSVDSEEEWDEGGPGESLSGTENEIESEDDYEVDNEFFVPHGYLSAEEEKEEDEVESDPEKQKAKLKIKQQEFEMERKKKTTELKPLILGCYIENLLEFQDQSLCSFLQAYTGEMVSDSPILTCITVKKLQAESKLHSNTSTPVAKQSSAIKKKRFPEEAIMPHLIRLVHGNTNSRDTLVKEFQSFWRENCPIPISSEDADATSKEENPQKPNSDQPLSEPPENLPKRQLHILIKKIATYGKISHPTVKKCCWYVHDEVREKHGLQEAPIPNEWNYQCPKEEAEASASPVTKLNCASIKEFLIP